MHCFINTVKLQQDSNQEMQYIAFPRLISSRYLRLQLFSECLEVKDYLTRTKLKRALLNTVAFSDAGS